MNKTDSTCRLTTAQAIVRWLSNQFIEIDGEERRLFGGGFGIFGHGNVACLGEALHAHRDELPLYRGQNEQSMGFAAAAYAKYHLRQRMMFCTASAGPGTSNLLTSAALANANRLPMLLLCGDTYLTRLPDPVLQQIEHFGDPTLGVNDAFKAVTRYWDRISHPLQIMQSLPQAIGILLDPADCGPAFIGLPQDVQGWAHDYPERFFARTVHRVRRAAPDELDVAAAAALIARAERPMIIAGGGVQYSGAVAELTAFAEERQIPVVETIAGRANLLATHALNTGPIGVTGSNSANAIAERADVIVAVGTRLQDFTTGSWTAFAKEARIIGLNVGRHDAGKHGALSVIGDARRSLPLLNAALGDYVAPERWTALAAEQRRQWDAYVAQNVAHGNRPNSYAQAIGVVNALCHADDRVVAAAGGLPAQQEAPAASSRPPRRLASGVHNTAELPVLLLTAPVAWPLRSSAEHPTATGRRSDGRRRAGGPHGACDGLWGRSSWQSGLRRKTLSILYNVRRRDAGGGRGARRGDHHGRPVVLNASEPQRTRMRRQSGRC